MKYISFNENSGWDHRPYWVYLDSIRSKMPETLYRFAANPKHHDLSSHVSLHDAWLEQLSIREISETNDRSKRLLLISTSYLGPFHDVRIHIDYRRVSGYELRNPLDLGGSHFPQTSHGDLAVHEVRLVGENSFEHEIVFSRGSVFVIQFEEFEHRIEPIESSI